MAPDVAVQRDDGPPVAAPSGPSVKYAHKDRSKQKEGQLLSNHLVTVRSKSVINQPRHASWLLTKRCPLTSHHLLEAAIHDLFCPEVAHAVLHPLEVGDRHAAGVGEDVGHDEDAFRLENLVGIGRGRAVGTLDDDLGLNARSVGRGDLVLGRGGHQQIAVEFEQLLAVDAFGAREAFEGAVLVEKAEDGRHVQAVLIVDRAVDVRDRRDLVAHLLNELGAQAADVAAALDHHAAARVRHADVLQRFARRLPWCVGRGALSLPLVIDGRLPCVNVDTAVESS